MKKNNEKQLQLPILVEVNLRSTSFHERDGSLSHTEDTRKSSKDDSRYASGEDELIYSSIAHSYFNQLAKIK